MESAEVLGLRTFPKLSLSLSLSLRHCFGSSCQ